MPHKSYRPTIPFSITGFYSAFDMRWNQSFDFLGERHDFWEVVVVVAGEVEVVEDGRIYRLHEGQLICHAPNEFHRIKSAGGTNPHVLITSFAHNGTLPQRLHEGVFALSPTLLEEYRSIFDQFYPFFKESYRQKHPSMDEALAQNAYVGLHRLEAFLLRLSQYKTTSEPLSKGPSATEYRRLVHTMRAKVYSGLSLEELAKEHHISQSYVKKLFHFYAGVGAMTYFANLRIKEIKHLLDTGETLNAIAERMNFSSAAYLSAFFKKHVGMSPSQYRLQK